MSSGYPDDLRRQQGPTYVYGRYERHEEAFNEHRLSETELEGSVAHLLPKIRETCGPFSLIDDCGG